MKNNMIVSEIKVTYEPEFKNMPKLHNTKHAFFAAKAFFEPGTLHLQEQVIAIYLNKGNRIIGVYPVSKGGITSAVVDIRLILGVALKVAATGIILAHNHPSGNPIPSKADIFLTKRLKEAAKLFDIELMDHIIVMDNATCTSIIDQC